MTERALRRAAWASFALWGLFLNAQVGFIVATPASASADLDAGGVTWSILTAAFPISAIVILTRQPRNRIGWILIVIGLLSAEPMGAYASFALATGWPGGLLAAVLNGPMWVPQIGLIGTILLLRFPDGRLPSPRWRKVEWLVGAAIAIPMVVLLLEPRDLAEMGYPDLRNPIGIEPLREVLSAALSAVILVPIAIVACVTSLIVRFRRSRGPERQQLKWLTAAASLVAGWYLLGMLLSLVTGALWGETAPWLSVIDAVSPLLFMLIPLAIGIAVLRYRLYEIDRIISRTVGYAIVTVILGTVFGGLVVGVQALALPLVGRSELAIVLSTLAVAGLFGPVRRRVQDLVDRRFDRARYDGVRVAETFGARLRDRLDLDDVSAELVSTAHAALRPVSATVWVRPRPLRRSG